ncbi:MAG TPA: DUF222 domain-containing protein, partial [Nocardioidaceae bacterium]|nr:DUF222 domain-containing protein [Nocardioidaceae bacterium]
MSTTDQHRPAGSGEQPEPGWAVPGVDRPAAVDAAADVAAGAASAATGDSQPAGTDRAGAEAPARDVVDDLDELRTNGGGGSAPGGVHPVLQAVHDCLYALRSCRESSTLSLTGEEIKVLIVAITQIISQAIALKLKLVRAADAADLAGDEGSPSTATWLSRLTQTVRSKASGQVRTAADLDRRYQLLGAAFAEGRVSSDQVTVCLSLLRRLPKDLPADAVAACQEFLIDVAADHDPTELAKKGKELWARIDPDGADAAEGKRVRDEEDLARAKAWFTHWRNGDGTTGFRGKLPDAQFDI